MGIGEVDVDREPLEPASVQAHDGPALAGGRECQKPALPDREQPVAAVAQPAELALAAASAEELDVAASHLSVRLALAGGRRPTWVRMVLACLALERLDRRLTGGDWPAQAEESRQRLQIESIGHAHDVDHQAVVFAGSWLSPSLPQRLLAPLRAAAGDERTGRDSCAGPTDPRGSLLRRLTTPSWVSSRSSPAPGERTG
jgi:hypothetical protein